MGSSTSRILLICLLVSAQSSILIPPSESMNTLNRECLPCPTYSMPHNWYPSAITTGSIISRNASPRPAMNYSDAQIKNGHQAHLSLLLADPRRYKQKAPNRGFL